MKITGVTTYLVGNPWKNWLFVRVDTDEGIHGVGEGTVNGFSATVETAIRELADAYLGLEPSQVELLYQRMVRDVYTDGGQIHMAAVAAIEVACWDIVGKAAGKPVYDLLGGRVRSEIPVYANGWYRTRPASTCSTTSGRRTAPATWSGVGIGRSSSIRSGPRGGSWTGAKRTSRWRSWRPSAMRLDRTST